MRVAIKATSLGGDGIGYYTTEEAVDFLQFQAVAEKPAKLLAYLKPILRSQKHQRPEVDK